MMKDVFVMVKFVTEQNVLKDCNGMIHGFSVGKRMQLVRLGFYMK